MPSLAPVSGVPVSGSGVSIQVVTQPITFVQSASPAGSVYSRSGTNSLIFVQVGAVNDVHLVANALTFAQVATDFVVHNISASNAIIFVETASPGGSIWARAGSNTVTFAQVPTDQHLTGAIASNTITFVQHAAHAFVEIATNAVFFGQAATETVFPAPKDSNTLFFGQAASAYILRQQNVGHSLNFVQATQGSIHDPASNIVRFQQTAGFVLLPAKRGTNTLSFLQSATFINVGVIKPASNILHFAQTATHNNFSRPSLVQALHFLQSATYNLLSAQGSNKLTFTQLATTNQKQTTANNILKFNQVAVAKGPISVGVAQSIDFTQIAKPNFLYVSVENVLDFEDGVTYVGPYAVEADNEFAFTQAIDLGGSTYHVDPCNSLSFIQQAARVKPASASNTLSFVQTLPPVSQNVLHFVQVVTTNALPQACSDDGSYYVPDKGVSNIIKFVQSVTLSGSHHTLNVPQTITFGQSASYWKAEP